MKPNFVTNPPSKTEGLQKVNQRKYADKSHNAIEDVAIIEEPLLISLHFFDTGLLTYKTTELTLIMRTPGDDDALITGFLFNEQIITSVHDILSIKFSDEAQNNNHRMIKLKSTVSIDWKKVTRSFPSQSSCGICGKTSLNALSLKTEHSIDNSEHWLKADRIIQFAQDLKNHQPLFKESGSAHGAGYITDNKWICVYEDVGRHNAVDKVVGHILNNNLFSKKSILVLSGRVSFELIQKAVTASIPVIIAIGAPSSLAISAAIQFNITLIGFTKKNQFNVYHGNHRISDDNKTG